MADVSLCTCKSGQIIIIDAVFEIKINYVLLIFFKKTMFADIFNRYQYTCGENLKVMELFFKRKLKIVS